MFTEITERFSSNLKRLREDKKFTQEDMADAMWRDPRTIRRWEKGDICPSALAELADFFSVSVEEFFRV